MQIADNNNRINWAYFPLCFLPVLFSFFYGVLDDDYYMDIFLGREELLNRNFNAVYSLQFGTVGNDGYYLDHEWLYNIFLYLLSQTGKYHIVISNIVIHALFAFVLFLVIKEFSHKKEIGLQELTIKYVAVVTFTISFIRLKAYSVGLISIMLMMVLIHRYYVSPKRKYLVFGGLLLLITNNIHSATYLIELLICAAAFLMLSELRSKETVIAGLAYAAIGIINPFGYHLLLFNFSHNNNSAMKAIVTEWQRPPAEKIAGLYFIIVYLFLHETEDKKTLLRWFIIASALFVYSLTEARQAMFLSLFLLMYVFAGHYDLNENAFEEKALKRTGAAICVILATIIAVRCVTFLSTTAYESFCTRYSKETQDAIEEYSGYNIAGLSLLCQGYKSFHSPAFPVTEERVADWTKLQLATTKKDIDKFAEKYDVHGFFIPAKEGQPLLRTMKTYGKYSYIGTYKEFCPGFVQEYALFIDKNHTPLSKADSKY